MWNMAAKHSRYGWTLIYQGYLRFKTKIGIYIYYGLLVWQIIETNSDIHLNDNVNGQIK